MEVGKVDQSAFPGGWKRTWARLWSPVVSLEARDSCYRLYHNVIMCRERENRMGRVPDPFCPVEAVKERMEGPVNEGGVGPGMLAVGGPVGDWVHTHCGCARVHGMWSWVRGRCQALLHREDIPDRELVYLLYSPGPAAVTVTWLVTSYLQFVWAQKRQGTVLSVKNLRSFLAEKLLAVQADRAGALIYPCVLDDT